MNKFIREVIFRWTFSPWWIKMIDITCWAALFMVLIFLF